MDYKTGKFKLSNIFELSKLVGRLWNLDEEIKSKVLCSASCYAYSFFMLSKSNYKVVITKDNKQCSFLLADIICKRNVLKYFYLFLSFLFVFIMMFFKDGRSIFKYQLQYNKLSSNLIKNNPKTYDAELVLFVTNEKYQGNGFGKINLQQFHNYLLNLNKHNIFLMTDNYSNYKIYDKAGCNRVSEDSANLYFLAGVPFTQELYLYDYKIN